MKKVKKIWNFISYVIIVIAVILALLLAGVRVFGIGVYSVMSQSMEPTLKLGSVVYVDQKNLKLDELEVGDVITFMLNEDTLATHRITQIIPSAPKYGGYEFKTKGDHPDSKEDIGTVLGVNVLGEVKFTIPYLGYLSSYIQEPPGMYVAISVGAILLLFVFLPDLIFETDEEKKKRLEAEAAKAKAKAEKLGKTDAENTEPVLNSADAENGSASNEPEEAAGGE